MRAICMMPTARALLSNQGGQYKDGLRGGGGSGQQGAGMGEIKPEARAARPPGARTRAAGLNRSWGPAGAQIAADRMVRASQEGGLSDRQGG